MILNPDSQALLLLCSHLALSSSIGYSPLSLRDWNPLAKKMQSLSMRPAALLGLNSEELKELLGVAEEESQEGEDEDPPHRQVVGAYGTRVLAEQLEMVDADGLLGGIGGLGAAVLSCVLFSMIAHFFGSMRD